MNKLFFLLLLCSMFITYCVSTKVSLKNNFDYSVLQNNTNYIVQKNYGEKLRKFQFIEQTEDKIIGKQNGKDIEINKKVVTSVKKPSAGKTVGLVAGSVLLFVVVGFIPAAESN